MIEADRNICQSCAPPRCSHDITIGTPCGQCYAAVNVGAPGYQEQLDSERIQLSRQDQAEVDLRDAFLEKIAELKSENAKLREQNAAILLAYKALENLGHHETGDSDCEWCDDPVNEDSLHEKTHLCDKLRTDHKRAWELRVAAGLPKTWITRWSI